MVGKAAERAVRFSDLSDDGALDEAIRRLEKLGIDQMLSRAGIREGDLVVVGDLEFTWWRDQTAKGLDPDELPAAPAGGQGGTVIAERLRLVVKIGSSSVTGSDGAPDAALLGRLASEIGAELAAGTDVVVVSSGAVAAGWAAIGGGAERPSDLAVLQAVSAVGQHRLMSAWADGLRPRRGRWSARSSWRPLDFADRSQYLHARQTLDQLLAWASSPIVNENDAVADEEIRFGDNDRLAALVAHLVGAERLVLLTDAPGPADGRSPRRRRGLAHRGGGRDRPLPRGRGRRPRRGRLRRHGIEAGCG